ncbi:hypothetical protein P9990_26775 (plasmid) [Prescottella equi]|uniref:hypothetical protein n=1 Tax=Rhodococcus hoagii TaxID=43767 RepID=UPI0025755939|nr:hypothetical protein [Prescottella equi]WJJ14418.1 hypothetical protein P9990_26775 [Prescottella equi]
MNRLRLRRAVVVAGAGAVLLVTAQPAVAAPTDTVFPIPVVWVGLGVTNLPAGDIEYITARTDPATPGVTRFTGAARAVHWRNLSTGANGSVMVGWPSVEVRTGPGIVVATAAGWGWTILAGAGGWTVP